MSAGDRRPEFGPAPLDHCSCKVGAVAWYEGCGWTVAPVQVLGHLGIVSMVRPRVAWGLS